MDATGFLLTRTDALRLKGAARFVETLSRESTNITPTFTPIGGMQSAITPETVMWPAIITADAGSYYVADIKYRDGATWQTQSAKVITPPGHVLGVGTAVWTMLVGDDGTDLIFAAVAPEFGCGILLDETTGKYKVDLGTIAGDGLTVVPGTDGACDTLKVVTGGGSETIDCGLSRAGGKLHVDLTSAVTDGITWGVGEACSLSWNPGCGMTVGVSPSNGNAALSVNMDTIAGDKTITALVPVGSPVVSKGDHCPSVGVDLTVEDPVITFTTDKITGLAITGGNLKLSFERRSIQNYYNAAGLHIDLVVGGPVAMSFSVPICDTTACCSADPLTVSCIRSTSSTTTGTTVTFTATPAGGTSPYTYLWEFGDGATSTSNPATHAYSAAGTYSPLVTVTDACGQSAFCFPGDITITSPPPPPPCCESFPDLCLTIAGAEGDEFPPDTPVTLTYDAEAGYWISDGTQFACADSQTWKLQCADGVWTAGLLADSGYLTDITFVSASCSPVNVVFSANYVCGGTEAITLTFAEGSCEPAPGDTTCELAYARTPVRSAGVTYDVGTIPDGTSLWYYFGDLIAALGGSPPLTTGSITATGVAGLCGIIIMVAMAGDTPCTGAGAAGGSHDVGCHSGVFNLNNPAYVHYWANVYNFTGSPQTVTFSLSVAC